MDEFQEKRKIVQAVPVSHPASESEYRSVVHERRGYSGVAVAALVIAAIAAAIVVTMVIMNNQQRDRDDELARERAQAANVEPQQQPSQQPPIVVMPPSSSAPAQVPVPTPVPSPPQAAPAPAARSSAEIEADVASRLLGDSELRSHPIDVKVSGGIATLSGTVPSEALKSRAERIARRIKGVESVINNIDVQNQP